MYVCMYVCIYYAYNQLIMYNLCVRYLLRIQQYPVNNTYNTFTNINLHLYFYCVRPNFGFKQLRIVHFFREN